MKKLGLKEELELEITNIKTEKIKEGKELKREDLTELSRIGATMESYGIPAKGEYKDYFFEVDENYKVTVINKLKGVKPTITANIVSTDSTIKVEIQVIASISEGTIKSIEATNGATLKESEENTDTQKTFTVTENGTYYFEATSDIGRIAIARVEVSGLSEKYFLFKEGIGRENWEFVNTQGTTLDKSGAYIYMRGAGIYGVGGSGCVLAYLKEKIDLSRYSKLWIDIEAITTQPDRVGNFGVTNNPANEIGVSSADTSNDINTTERTNCFYTIPKEFATYSPFIREMNGHSGTYSEIKIYNVWLEE